MHIAIAMYVFLMDLAMFLNCDHDDNDVPTLINCGSSQRGAEHMELIAHFKSWDSYVQGGADCAMVKLCQNVKLFLTHKLEVTWLLLSKIWPASTLGVQN